MSETLQEGQRQDQIVPADAYSREMQGTRLRQLATAAGYPELAKFARAAGIEPGTADKHVQREKVPTHAAEKYINAARHTGASVEWLLYGKGKPPTPMSAPVPNQLSVSYSKVTTSPVDTGPYVFVPLWRVRVHQPAGGQVLIAKTSESVLAPSELRNSSSSFGLQVWDDVNAPWMRRGTMLFVDPVRIPTDGQWCLLASQVEEATLYSPVLGILVEVEDGQWILQRGTRREKYAVADWPLAFLVAYTRPS